MGTTVALVGGGPLARGTPLGGRVAQAGPARRVCSAAAAAFPASPSAARQGSVRLGRGARTRTNKRGTRLAATSSYSGGEETVFDLKTHPGDPAINTGLGITLVWLPLTIAAWTRYLSVNFKITNKRVTITTRPPWKSEEDEERTDIMYKDIVSVKSVSRGVGLWGDMVIELRNKDKMEMRSVPKFKEVEKYIADMAALASEEERLRETKRSTAQNPKGTSGFS